MATVTYFSARQKALEVLAAGAPIGFTAVPISTFVPSGTTAVIAFVEITAAAAGAANDYAEMGLRKNVVAGLCDSVPMPKAAIITQTVGDNCIIPITTTRQFEYSLNGIFATLLCDLRVYLIGYIA